MRLLVIDDDGDLRDAICRYTALIGIEGVEADSAETALQLLQREQFDVATLDMRMDPGIGGAGFLEQYQRYAPKLPVIVLTGYPMAGIPVRAIPELTTGNITYLEKPVDMEVLKQVIFDSTNPQWGRFCINRFSGTVEFDGSPIKVTGTQYKLLDTLIPSAGTFTSYATLATAVYGEDMSGEEALSKLRSHVSRLRTLLAELLGAEGAGDLILQSEYGSGLRLPTEADLEQILENS